MAAKHDEKILDIEQAKRYFISMGCSHFHLCRESEQRANEYYTLEISKDLEKQWRKEDFERRSSEIDSSDLKDLWWRYSKLGDMIEKNDFYLEKMMELTDKIRDFLPTDKIHVLLHTIIGNNATKAKGGLIQAAFEIDRLDLVYKFIAQAKFSLEKAEKEEIPLSFVRGDFVDVIEYFKLNENPIYLKQLREKDNISNFKYYKEGAEEGNKCSMKMLADCYRNGVGCDRNVEQAKIWQKKADAI